MIEQCGLNVGFIKWMAGRQQQKQSTSKCAPSMGTKNIIEDLTRSVQISQEMLRSSYKIYLMSRILLVLIRYLLYRVIRISKIRSDQDSEQINSDLSGNIYSKENRLSKITLYRSDQDSEQINSDLSGDI